MTTIIVKKRKINKEHQVESKMVNVNAELKGIKIKNELSGDEKAKRNNEIQAEIKKKRLSNCKSWMRKNFPFIFSNSPLKVGIDKDIIAEYRKQNISVDLFSARTISGCLQWLINKSLYLENLAKDDSKRYDVNGNVVCDVDDDHRQYARELLTKRKEG